MCLAGANELFGKNVTADEVMNEARKDKIFYETSGGGITLSGGEPSMQADFALEIIEKAKNEGIGTAIETCGYGERDFYKKAFEMGATFLYDLKCMDSERHKDLTGVPNERIIENLEMLFSLGADVIIRLPMIPGVNDNAEDLDLLCAFLKKHEGKYRYAEIMPYHSFGVAKAERIGKKDVFCQSDATKEDKDRLVREFANRGIDVKISQ
jgi:pyruvate formate lyase activating enzyme